MRCKSAVQSFIPLIESPLHSSRSSTPVRAWAVPMIGICWITAVCDGNATLSCWRSVGNRCTADFPLARAAQPPLSELPPWLGTSLKIHGMQQCTYVPWSSLVRYPSSRKPATRYKAVRPRTSAGESRRATRPPLYRCHVLHPAVIGPPCKSNRLRHTAMPLGG